LGGCWSVTAKTISLVVLFLVVIILFSQLFQTRVILRPISVPRAFQESGFTSEVATAALGTAISQIRLEPNSRANIPISRISTEPTMEVPSTGLSLDTIRQVVRRVLGLSDLEITGEFVCHKPDCHRNTELWIHFDEDGVTLSRRVKLANRYPTDDELAEAAIFLLERADPFAAALHHVALAERPNTTDSGNHLSRALVLAERLQVAPRDSRDRYWSAGLICGIKRRQQHYDEAITWCKSIREKEPGYSYAQNNLGVLHLMLAKKAPSEAIREKHFEHALAAFAAAMDDAPSYANAFINHGFTLMKSGSEDYALIESRYKRAIELNPTFNSYYYSISAVYAAQRRYLDQVLALKWAIAVSSDDSDIKLLQREIDLIVGKHP